MRDSFFYQMNELWKSMPQMSLRYLLFSFFFMHFLLLRIFCLFDALLFQIHHLPEYFCAVVNE